MSDKTEPAEAHRPAKKVARTARIERYLFTKPDGEVVTIEHNIETGQTKIVGKEA